jgi:hypothetical protein
VTGATLTLIMHRARAESTGQRRHSPTPSSLTERRDRIGSSRGDVSTALTAALRVAEEDCWIGRAPELEAEYAPGQRPMGGASSLEKLIGVKGELESRGAMSAVRAAWRCATEDSLIGLR